jgi:hypothetical protein
VADGARRLADAERVGNDPVDRALVAEIREYMDELAPS